MAWLETNHGRLLVGFRFRGEACREYFGLDENRENRRSATKIAKEIELELAAGKFDYAARFPESPKLAHFGLTPPPGPAAAEENQKPQAPTLARSLNRGSRSGAQCSQSRLPTIPIAL